MNEEEDDDEKSDGDAFEKADVEPEWVCLRGVERFD